jgi:hypothetical protein
MGATARLPIQHEWRAYRRVAKEVQVVGEEGDEEEEGVVEEGLVLVYGF